MALKKSTINESINLTRFNDISEAIEFFKNSSEISDKHYAIDEMFKFENGIKEIVNIFRDSSLDNSVISYISAGLEKLDPKNAPIDDILEILNSENAYLRNKAIEILRNYGQSIKYYIVKYLIGDDRDLRIFAINVLGDVNFSESRDMLIELLENEKDINVAMTAVDYLAEIGQEEDIPLLEKLKDRFIEEPYAQFAINNAIKSIKG